MILEIILRGNSRVCLYLLEALGIQVGSYGGTVRFSEYASQKRDYIRKNGSMKSFSNNKASKNEEIDLYVITNRNTFSLANKLGIYVRDGKLGRIVGEASSNAPCAYGDIIRFQLNNSRLQGTVSHKKWIRPDASKEQEDTLEPDWNVPEEALEYILDRI